MGGITEELTVVSVIFLVVDRCGLFFVFLALLGFCLGKKIRREYRERKKGTREVQQEEDEKDQN